MFKVRFTSIGATRVKILGGQQNYLFKITHRGLISKSIKDICGGLNLSQRWLSPLSPPSCANVYQVSKY